ncbi:MAG: 2,3-bisphosphoglycerate-independent phosphoglycerate mutase, partial [Rikenellaceae bacterium]|nr:2,3-bisphosphoglycerate-independent phosphoglycerate mutase [Rikenellaceae bacterium]
MGKKVLLMILDGWGNGDHSNGDVVYSAKPEFIQNLQKQWPTAQLMTCGEHVGLPDGQMGNSEVGHLNIGAGRVIYQDLVKINKAIEDNTISKNNTLVDAFEYAKNNNKQ